MTISYVVHIDGSFPIKILDVLGILLYNIKQAYTIGTRDRRAQLEPFKLVQ